MKMLTATGIEALVCQDIERRQAHGIAKYGTTVAENPLTHRQWLQHAYEEALDMAVYLRRSMADEATQPEPAAPSPDLTPMTAHRAAYFMERFQKEEKLLGPNEQAAVRFVLEMLEREDAAPAVEPEPVAWMWQHDETGRTGFVEAGFDPEHWKHYNPRLQIVAPVYRHPPRAALSDTEIEALRADAMRYRWLLEKSGFGIRRNGVHELSFAFYVKQPNHINELNACIDADLQASKEAKP